MDDASIEYLRHIADDLYDVALMLDKIDEQDLCTANLELAFAVQKEMFTSGAKVFLAPQHLNDDGGDVCR